MPRGGCSRPAQQEERALSHDMVEKQPGKKVSPCPLPPLPPPPAPWKDVPSPPGGGGRVLGCGMFSLEQSWGACTYLPFDGQLLPLFYCPCV